MSFDNPLVKKWSLILAITFGIAALILACVIILKILDNPRASQHSTELPVLAKITENIYRLPLLKLQKRTQTPAPTREQILSRHQAILAGTKSESAEWPTSYYVLAFILLFSFAFLFGYLYQYFSAPFKGSVIDRGKAAIASDNPNHSTLRLGKEIEKQKLQLELRKLIKENQEVLQEIARNEYVSDRSAELFQLGVENMASTLITNLAKLENERAGYEGASLVKLRLDFFEHLIFELKTGKMAESGAVSV
jgi:hypothetical protein